LLIEKNSFSQSKQDVFLCTLLALNEKCNRNQ
jgi:hypothetical protein